MHFGDDYPFQELTLDRAAAEEALLIAARLQHVEKERLTVSDLKRSAAELNIDPELVDRALLLMHARRLDTVRSERHFRFLDVFALIVLWGLECCLLVTLITNSFVEVAPVWLTIAVVPAVFAYALPNNRRVWRVIVLALVFGALAALIGEWNMYLARDMVGHAVWVVPLAILVQAGVFSVSQRINSRMTRSATFAASER